MNDEEKEELKRDYEIFKEIKKIYELEWQRTELLHEKAINVVTSTGIIMALFVGLGTFSLEHILPSNPFYFCLSAIMIGGLALFALTILVGLSAYGIMPYEVPDPSKFIDEYKNAPLDEYIHFYGADTANSISENRTINAKRAGTVKNALTILLLGLFAIVIYAVLILFALQIK